MRDRSALLKDVLWILVLVGAVAVGLRLWFGLGATTNLSHAAPWGLWKILNMVAGVALATGGFTVCLLVHVLGIERLRPLVKPAILVAFLGYGSSVLALALDIGLPHRIWHPFVMGNPHSFLFEVAVCVACYFAVTVVELTPTILERFPRWRRAVQVLHHATPVLSVVGITLSSLHHTSLGSLFLVTPQRLHPLWYSTWLPLLFIVSAMGAGMMVVVLVTTLWCRLYEPHAFAPPPSPRHRVEHGKGATGPVPVAMKRITELGSLATVAAGVLALFVVLKVVDLYRTGAWAELLAGTWESVLWLAEITLIGLLPVGLMLSPRRRRSPGWITAAALAAALGLVLNRLDVGIFGYLRDARAVYVPSLAEWAVSLGLIAATGLVFLAVAERFPVFDDAWRQRGSSRRRFQAGFDSLSGVWRAALGERLRRVSLLAVLVVPVAWLALYPPYRSPDPCLTAAVQPPRAVDAGRAVLRIDGDGEGLWAVAFPHLDHRRRLGGERSCPRCHHLALPRDHATPCSRCHRLMHAETDLFDHGAHLASVAGKERLGGLHPGNRSCPYCHLPPRPASAIAVKPCLECHRDDMAPSLAFEAPGDLRRAPSYRTAFHRHCVPCHRREAERQGRPGLAECRHCHPTTPVVNTPKPPAAGGPMLVEAGERAPGGGAPPARRTLATNRRVTAPEPGRPGDEAETGGV